MKKLISLVVILFAFTLMSFSQSPIDLYEKYKDDKGVTAMIMNEELFKMVEGMDIEVQDEVNTILDEINKMIILSSEEVNFLDEVDLKGYDELMNVNEGDEVAKIYGKIKKERIKELIILAKEGNECNLVYIKGDLDLKNLGEIANQNMKKEGQ